MNIDGWFGGHFGDETAPHLALTAVPPALNALLEKRQLLHLFAAAPKWAVPALA